ncbi:MAG TPA: alpha/beta hydrolase [Ramlibacter sp.]|nr:alpha/beta hydrolase [Ramlibacter sp.]
MRAPTPAERKRTPPLAMLFSDPIRALVEWSAGVASAGWLATAPHGDGQPVLVLPGLFAGDGYTATTRAFLRAKGFAAHPWGGGRNDGHWEALDEVVLPAIRRLHADTGRRVALVGASMGGLFAREAARRLPQQVRCVVSLASAATGPHRSNHVWQAFEHATGQPAETLSAPPPPVPSTSVYTRLDGLSDWRPCLQPTSGQAENVQVASSHLGLAWHPAVLYLLADRLAQPEGAWRPFTPPPAAAHLYG